MKTHFLNRLKEVCKTLENLPPKGAFHLGDWFYHSHDHSAKFIRKNEE